MKKRINLLLLAVVVAALMNNCSIIGTHLTPQGARIKMVIHQEAPEGAIFLGYVDTDYELTGTTVKISLRNKAAKLGGNLLVVDEINIKRHNSYAGSGRVYKIEE